MKKEYYSRLLIVVYGRKKNRLIAIIQVINDKIVTKTYKSIISQKPFNYAIEIAKKAHTIRKEKEEPKLI